MKTAKRIAGIVLCIITISLLPLSAFAAPNEATPYGVSMNDLIFEPNYVNISTAFLSRDDTWISADVTAKSDMNLRIDIKVYKNGSLVDTFYTTSYGMICAFYTDYDFIKGASYKVEATYTAGTERTTKKLSFTQ